MPRKPYTQTEITRIVRLRMSGHHPADIAHFHGRTETAVSRLLSVEKKARNIEYPPIERTGTVWTLERIDAIAIQRPFKPYRELAGSYGISVQRLGFLMAKRAHAIQQGVWRG